VNSNGPRELVAAGRECRIARYVVQHDAAGTAHDRAQLCLVRLVAGIEIDVERETTDLNRRFDTQHAQTRDANSASLRDAHRAPDATRVGVYIELAGEHPLGAAIARWRARDFDREHMLAA